MTKHFPLKKIKLINQFISPTYQRLSKDKVQGRFCTGFKRKMWPDKATVTSEQLTFLFGILQLISPHSWKHAGNKSVSCSGLSRGSHVMTWVVHVESKSHHLKANLWAHVLLFSLLSATFLKFFTGFIVLLLYALQNGAPQKNYLMFICGRLLCHICTSRWQHWTVFNIMVLKSREESDTKQQAAHN